MNRRHETTRAVDRPEPGCFRLRLVKHGPWVGARITCAGGLWSAEIDGAPPGAAHPDPAVAADVLRVWDHGVRISESECAYLVARGRWARQNAPADPAANPTRPINFTTMRSLF